MKWNLKNLISDLEELKKNIEIDVPSLQNGYYLNKVDSILGQVEGFEKELREELVPDEAIAIRSMHDNVKGKLAAQARQRVIKEILGVEAKT